MKAGLTTAQAKQLQKENGLNEIKEQASGSLWALFFDQFKSPLVIVLVFACVVSIFLGETVEALAIGTILLINALIGFFQEFRAETAIAALRDMTSPRAKVLRDGRQQVVLAREVVPGDILLLEAGEIVAADATLLEASNFQVNEAVLTGESLPIEKDTSISPQIFMGTSVVRGSATAQVNQIGMRTELGKIAQLITSAKQEPTPLQIQLEHIGKSLLSVCLVLVGLIAIIGIAQGNSWVELLVFSLSLAVAAVPEGLPAIVTVALALGVQRMAARNALVRKLPSVETLGSVSVICTDKTGTLTAGVMRVREVWADNHSQLLNAAASCCDAELEPESTEGVGDPTEIAILVAARERGFERENLETLNPRVSIEPFDSERKRMSILRADGINYVKGAIESLAPLCNNSDYVTKALDNATEMASRGLRTLGVATGLGAGEANLTLIGILGFADPPRTEAGAAIAEARHAGVKSIMITGDHPQTARAIAKELGLVIEGESLDELVHARATPEDKLVLVRRWKDRGEIVAMTGDGVNDAPALREAHVGIAMGKTGTEVTRQASDIILADDNFATIVAAIREGRGIFQNIRKAIIYLLTGNFAEIAFILAAILFGFPIPLLAAHLLWINLVTDGLPALTLIADPTSSDLMERRPRKLNEKIIGTREWRQIAWVGLLEAATIFILYWILLDDRGETHARSLAFTTFVFSQLARSFAARSTTQVFWQVGALSNLWLLGVVAISGCIQLSLHFVPLTQKVFSLVPLSLQDFEYVIPFSLVTVTVLELKKLVIRRNMVR